MMGYTPTATARPTMPSSHKKPKGGRVQKAASSWPGPPGRPPLRPMRGWRGAICRVKIWPFSASMWNSTTSPGSDGWRVAMPRSTRLPAGSRTAISREGGTNGWLFWAFCSSAMRQAQPTVSVSTAMPPTTASQMRR